MKTWLECFEEAMIKSNMSHEVKVEEAKIPLLSSDLASALSEQDHCIFMTIHEGRKKWEF